MIAGSVPPAPITPLAPLPTLRQRLVHAGICYPFFLLSLLVPAVILFIMLIFWVPKYVEIFKDFRMTLPDLTLRAIALSQFVRSLPGLVLSVVGFLFIFLLPLLPAWLFSGIRTPSRRRRAIILTTLLLLLVSTIPIFTTYWAIQLPLIKIRQSMFGGESGGNDPH